MPAPITPAPKTAISVIGAKAFTCSGLKAAPTVFLVLLVISAYPALLERLIAAAIPVRTDLLPTAATVASLAAPRALRGEGIDPALAAPLYIRDKVAKTVAERLSEGGRA